MFNVTPAYLSLMLGALAEYLKPSTPKILVFGGIDKP
jgi:hypothetical protein